MSNKDGKWGTKREEWQQRQRLSLHENNLAPRFGNLKAKQEEVVSPPKKSPSPQRQRKQKKRSSRKKSPKSRSPNTNVVVSNHDPTLHRGNMQEKEWQVYLKDNRRSTNFGKYGKVQFLLDTEVTGDHYEELQKETNKRKGKNRKGKKSPSRKRTKKAKKQEPKPVEQVVEEVSEVSSVSEEEKVEEVVQETPVVEPEVVEEVAPVVDVVEEEEKEEVVVDALEQVKNGLRELKVNELRDVRSYNTPPLLVGQTFAAVMCLLKEKEDWKTVRKVLAQPRRFNQRLLAVTIAKNNVTNRLWRKMRRKYKNVLSVSKEKSNMVSPTCTVICALLQTLNEQQQKQNTNRSPSPRTSTDQDVVSPVVSPESSQRRRRSDRGNNQQSRDTRKSQEMLSQILQQSPQPQQTEVQELQNSPLKSVVVATQNTQQQQKVQALKNMSAGQLEQVSQRVQVQASELLANNEDQLGANIQVPNVSAGEMRNFLEDDEFMKYLSLATVLYKNLRK